MTEKKNTEKPAGFGGLGVAPSLIRVLTALRFTVPTPIQEKAIPAAGEGRDIIGIAQTGTGKTLAFGLPMIERIARLKVMGLVLLPTRELARQVDQHLKMIGEKLGLRTAVMIGGESIDRQLKALRRRPHIIVATPGRLIDHLRRGSARLDKVGCLVLDEADMMLDMGFAPQIEKILKEVPKDRQTMLFSATMPPGIVRIASRHMKMPIRVEVAPSGTPVENITQEMIVLERTDKFGELKKILEKYTGSVLIFRRTKSGVKILCHDLKRLDYKVAEIHSDLTLARRHKALEGFKAGQHRILVATDIAARGLDINDIELVLNYDLPEQTEDYVHRIGRTARAGKRGTAISFAAPTQMDIIRQIERLIKKPIPRTQLAKVYNKNPKMRVRTFRPRRRF